MTWWAGVVWWTSAVIIGVGGALQIYFFPRIRRLVGENRRLLRQITDTATAGRRDVLALTQLVAMSIALKLLIRPQVDRELTEWDPPGRCPDCGSPELAAGPRAGTATSTWARNLTCTNCGARWNAVPLMRLIQRI